MRRTGERCDQANAATCLAGRGRGRRGRRVGRGDNPRRKETLLLRLESHVGVVRCHPHRRRCGHAKSRSGSVWRRRTCSSSNRCARACIRTQVVPFCPIPPKSCGSGVCRCCPLWRASAAIEEMRRRDGRPTGLAFVARVVVALAPVGILGRFSRPSPCRRARLRGCRPHRRRWPTTGT